MAESGPDREAKRGRRDAQATWVTSAPPAGDRRAKRGLGRQHQNVAAGHDEPLAAAGRSEEVDSLVAVLVGDGHQRSGRGDVVVGQVAHRHQREGPYPVANGLDPFGQAPRQIAGLGRARVLRMLLAGFGVRGSRLHRLLGSSQAFQRGDEARMQSGDDFLLVDGRHDRRARAAPLRVATARLRCQPPLRTTARFDFTTGSRLDRRPRK
jgi:hypothetical protein